MHLYEALGVLYDLRIETTLLYGSNRTNNEYKNTMVDEWNDKR